MPKILQPGFSEKVLFAFCEFSIDSNLWTQPYYGSKQKKLFKKPLPTNIENFLMSIVDLYQTCEIALTQNF